MRVVDLALKDLTQILRDWKSALFLAAMPIVFTIFFGLMFGPGAGNDPRLPLGFVNRDPGSVVCDDLQSLLETSDAVRLVVLEGEQAERAGEMVRDGDLAAALIAPAGFGERLLAGEDPRLTFVVDSKSPAGRTAGNAVQAAVTRMLGSVEAARLSAASFDAAVGFADEAARLAYLDESLALASTAWQRPPLTVAVEQTGPVDEEGDVISNAYARSSPGMLIQFVVFGLNTSATVLVLERKYKTLHRLLTTPISKGEVIAGHVLAMFTVTLAQQALLVGLGQLAFGVDYMRVPLAVFLVMATFSFWAASLGLLIGALSKGEEQVIIWALIAMFLFSALGGAWFPLDVTGKTFAAIGHLTPTAWAMDGFQNIVVRGLGLESALLPAGILLAYGLLFFGLAVWRFRFE